MSSAKYCYQCPILLGSGFQDTKTKELIGYEYKILIEGTEKGFKLISPSYLGEIPKFSIKKPDVKISKQGEKVTFIKRKKIITLHPTKSLTPEKEIEVLERVNKSMWELINPNLARNGNFEKIEIKSEEQENFYDKNSYNTLKKQYFVLPVNHKTGPEGVSTEVDMNLVKNFLSGPKTSKVAKKNDIYRDKKDKKIYIVMETMLSLKSASCFDFIQTLFDNCKGRNINMESLDDKNALFLLINNLGLKEIDMKKTKFIDYLYDNAIEGNNNVSDDYLKPLRTFAFKHPERSKIESGILVFTRNATTGITADFNFYENLVNYKTNKTLAKREIDFGDYELFLSKELENTKVKHTWMDVFAQLPAILINIERYAAVREFKIYNNFLFMKNYSLHKALCSRSYDKVMNNETLETLGDTVLKTIVTLNLFKNNSEMNEGGMTQARTKVINNKYLSKRGLESGLQFFLKSEFTPVKKWTPPLFDKSKSENYKEEQILSDKMIADSVEAIIGAALVSTNRLYEPLQVLKKFAIVEKFDFEGYEKFFTQVFKPDLECFKKLDKIVKKDISYRSLLRLSESDIYTRYKRNYKMKKRYEKIEKKPKGRAKTEDSELRQISDKDYFKNYVSDILMRYKPTKPKGTELTDNKIIFDFLRDGIFRKLEETHLGYTFKDKNLRNAGLRPEGVKKETKKRFERLEFLGDAVIEVLTIFIARKVFMHLKKSFTPEMLHAVKVVILSTEGLSRIFLHLKLHRFLLLGEINIKVIQEIRAFMQDYNPFLEFKHLWWQNAVSAPKLLADIVESLMGAVFLDGGWDALFQVFGRIVTPMVYYCCKYFDIMGTDLIHDIIAFFAKRGVKCEFKSDSRSCSVYLHNEGGKRKILRVDGSNESECKRKAAVRFMTEDKFKKEFTSAQNNFGEKFDIIEEDQPENKKKE